MTLNFILCDLNDKGAKATNCKRHTLDLIITNGLNVSDILVTDPSLSDHICVFFNIYIIHNHDIQTISNNVEKQCINEHSKVLLKRAISLLPPLNTCCAVDLVESFNLI